ncbi:hypothetical protein BG011_000363 [Mortierella polycephala]|uniref:Uncharacterized protein n=1 Tax=Mortierella polycephala TaxID=41804 RepID=A0A9P6Q7A7_9FUNG|nr:hypothetical protein BG011_000363 [Mortierella polycephala]
MAILPTFTSSCIAPDNAGRRFYLFGVVSSGHLEVHSVDLSNTLQPSSTLVSATTAAVGSTDWDPQSRLGCYSYMGDSPPANSPITVIQFGITIQAQFFPNGTWLAITTGSTTEAPFDYVSPKMFSLVGSTNGWNWFLARTTPKSPSADGSSSWKDVRIGSRETFESQDLTLTGSEPLLTVGAIAQDIANFGNGHLFTFEQSGSAGSVFRAIGNKRPDRNLTATETLVNVTKINAVDMGGVNLSPDAIPVTSAFAAFILDKSPKGTISMFSIDPRSATYKMVQSSINGMTPLFLSGQSVTSLNSKIVVYGGQEQGSDASTNVVHVFDVISGTWTGPALVDPASVGGQNTSSSGMSLGAVIGIAAGVVFLLLAVGLFVWRRRRKSRRQTIGSKQHKANPKRDSKEGMIDLKRLEGKRQPAPEVQDDQRKLTVDSNTTLAYTERVATAPNTPQSTKSHLTTKGSVRQQRSNSRPERSSRHNSMHSMRSNASSGHISLIPASSSIYLSESLSILPPTPTVPSVYTATTIHHDPRHLQRHPYNTASASQSQLPSRKGSVYKVTVSDSYDDRRPLHGEDTSVEYRTHQQSSSYTSTSDSPPSTSSSTDQSRRQGEKSRQPRQSTSRSRTQDTSTLPCLPTSSQPLSSASPRHAVNESALPAGRDQAPSPKQPSTPRQRKKKAPPEFPRSKTDPSPNLSSTANYRDSGSYKVEIKNPIILEQQQYHLSASTSSTGASLRAVPKPPTTPTTPRYTDHTSFADAAPRSNVTHTPSSAVPISNYSSSPHRDDQQLRHQHQQQSQQQSNHHNYNWQQQQGHIEHQQQQLTDSNNFVAQSPKTPKLGSLPRPIPRDANK